MRRFELFQLSSGWWFVGLFASCLVMSWLTPVTPFGLFLCGLDGFIYATLIGTK